MADPINDFSYHVYQGPSHPGGPLIYIYHGRDCTHVFDAFHGEDAYKLLEKFPSRPSMFLALDIMRYVMKYAL